MLPEYMQEELWGEISRNFGSDDRRLKKAALTLQDGGYAPSVIREILAGAYWTGFDDGVNSGTD